MGLRGTRRREQHLASELATFLNSMIFKTGGFRVRLLYIFQYFDNITEAACTLRIAL